MGELDILCQGTECCIRGFIELRQKLLCILWMDALFYTGYKLCSAVEICTFFAIWSTVSSIAVRAGFFR